MLYKALVAAIVAAVFILIREFFRWLEKTTTVNARVEKCEVTSETANTFEHKGSLYDEGKFYELSVKEVSEMSISYMEKHCPDYYLYAISKELPLQLQAKAFFIRYFSDVKPYGSDYYAEYKNKLINNSEVANIVKVAVIDVFNQLDLKQRSKKENIELYALYESYPNEELEKIIKKRSYNDLAKTFAREILEKRKSG